MADGTSGSFIIRGFVAAGDGTPIEGVQVIVGQNTSSPVIITATSDAQGRYEVEIPLTDERPHSFSDTHGISFYGPPSTTGRAYTLDGGGGSFWRTSGLEQDEWPEPGTVFDLPPRTMLIDLGDATQVQSPARIEPQQRPLRLRTVASAVPTVVAVSEAVTNDFPTTEIEHVFRWTRQVGRFDWITVGTEQTYQVMPDDTSTRLAMQNGFYLVDAAGNRLSSGGGPRIEVEVEELPRSRATLSLKPVVDGRAVRLVVRLREVTEPWGSRLKVGVGAKSRRIVLTGEQRRGTQVSDDLRRIVVKIGRVPAGTHAAFASLERNKLHDAAYVRRSFTVG